jgi:hypothetical protein
MIGHRPLAALSIVACVSAAAGLPALADNGWMTADAIRTAFTGKTLDGYYVDGKSFTESYNSNGRLDYRDDQRSGTGDWYIRGRLFCTFYDPGQGIDGGCFFVTRTGANCYEFHSAGGATDLDIDRGEPGPRSQWVARASRRGEASTCQSGPTI